MKRKPENKDKPLAVPEENFDEAMRPVDLPESPAKAADADTRPKPLYTAAALKDTASLPLRAQPVTVAFRDNENTTIHRGVYVVSGATGGGKSLTMLAVVDHLNRHYSADIAAAYLYVFEPGAPLFEKTAERSAADLLVDSTQRSLYSDPEFFMAELEQELIHALSKVGKRRIVMVIDSINLPIKAYKADKRAGQATFEGGMQPMDTQFLVDLSRLCEKLNATLLCTVNPDLLPVGKRLEASVEGVITIVSPGQFQKRERGTGRQDVMFSVPEKSFNAALQGLGYPGTAKSGASHPYNKI